METLSIRDLRNWPGAVQAPVIEPRVAGEYREVLLRPRFGLDAAPVHQLVDALEETGVPVTASPWPSVLRGRSDEILLATAMAGQAVLVTGNMADFPMATRHGVVLRTPRECLEDLRGQAPGRV